MVMNVAFFDAILLGRVPLHAGSESGPWCDVVNVLHDVAGNVIGLRRDVSVSVFVFPDVEVRNQQVLNLLSRGIKLDPLERNQGVSELLRGPARSYVLSPTCLLVEWPMRSLAIPPATIQSMITSTVSCGGAKNSMTSSGVMCFP